MEENLELDFHLDGLGVVINNLKRKGYRLAADFSDMRNDTLSLHGLLGVDVIKFMGPMRSIPCMRGSAFEFANGIIPFGNISDFQYPVEKAVKGGVSRLNYSQVISEYTDCPVTHVYYVLEPRSEYFDPVDSFCDSLVERKIEKLFDLESLGISENTFSDYDRDKLRDFQNSISYRDKCYFIDMPWDEDKLSTVPSNHGVALGVLNRVVDRLSSQNLYEEYCKVFLDQESEGIIERIDVMPADFGNHIWIPHRPIIKTDSQCTTKIRPVFNCSLRVGGGPSLNDCVYPGINLYTDMLHLLLKFRMDHCVLLADIRKAFLMIRLNSERDKNCFCFFMKIGNQLVSFRYKTLIFGFVASPFILNFIIKFHVNRYRDSSCKEMLLNNFYVDNLIKTHNSPEFLLNLYREARDVMAEGSFLLRSCNTNCEVLREEMKRDNSLVTHDSPFEKVLGYMYNPAFDELHIVVDALTGVANTKRGILSQNASVFDPLSLCLPITIKGRLLLSDMWKRNLKWDESVPSDVQGVWNRIFAEFIELDSLKFPRWVIDTSMEFDFIIFCDASMKAYGFASYILQKGSANLIFAKAKVAPLARKTLPSLELLSVVLAFKCLLNIVKNLSSNIGKIILAVDAQVVLSWILSEDIKTKNVFLKNRY